MLHRKIGLLDLIILILSVYVILALLVESFFKLPAEISRLLIITDNIICIIFLIDFFKRLYRAESKIHFLKWGWIDLISSIPSFDFMRVGRMFRLIRILRILRAFRSTKFLIRYIFRNRQQGALTAALLIGILMILFSSIAILQVETDSSSNIKTAEDALWWSYVTITTVGYGDKYPVTTEGRIIAMLLMSVGVGLFGTLTAYLAAWFVGKPEVNTID